MQFNDDLEAAARHSAFFLDTVPDRAYAPAKGDRVARINDILVIIALVTDDGGSLLGNIARLRQKAQNFYRQRKRRRVSQIRSKQVAHPSLAQRISQFLSLPMARIA